MDDDSQRPAEKETTMTFRSLSIALVIAGLLGLPNTALSEEQEHESAAPPAMEGSPPQGGMRKGMGMEGMHGGQGTPGQMEGAPSKGMAEMQAHMHALHEHSKKMEGIHDPDALMKEMRVHMRMMDEMMQAMMEHQAAPAPQPKPMGHM